MTQLTHIGTFFTAGATSSEWRNQQCSSVAMLVGAQESYPLGTRMRLPKGSRGDCIPWKIRWRNALAKVEFVWRCVAHRRGGRPLQLLHCAYDPSRLPLARVLCLCFLFTVVSLAECQVNLNSLSPPSPPSAPPHHSGPRPSSPPHLLTHFSLALRLEPLLATVPHTSPARGCVTGAIASLSHHTQCRLRPSVSLRGTRDISNPTNLITFKDLPLPREHSPLQFLLLAPPFTVHWWMTLNQWRNGGDTRGLFTLSTHSHVKRLSCLRQRRPITTNCTINTSICRPLLPESTQLPVSLFTLLPSTA